LEAALEAARRAGREIMKAYAAFEAIADAPADISTEADRRSQEIVLCYLRERFPRDAFTAEEATPTLEKLSRQGPRLWIIDPIDGTRGFAKKLGEFSVMVGLVENGEIRLGVVVEPARGRCTYALRGGGCWRQDGDAASSPCRVSGVNDWHEVRLVRSRSEKNNNNPSILAVKQHDYTYSAGIKLAQVARGEADVYLSTYTGFNSWDVCAGQILVEEAGGCVTDGLGEPIRYQPDGGGKIKGTAASNGHLHERAQLAIKEWLQ
jgi:3'(2'), 5'-bisphosphate nucleotidase